MVVMDSTLGSFLYRIDLMMAVPESGLAARPAGAAPVGGSHIAEAIHYRRGFQ